MSKSKFSDKINNKMNKSVNQIPYLNFNEAGEYILRLLPIPGNPDEPAFEKYEIHSKIYHPDFQKETQRLCLGPGCPYCSFAEEYQAHYPQDAWKVKSTAFFFWRIENKKTNALNYLKLTRPVQELLISLVEQLDNQGVSLQDTSEYGRDILVTVTKIQTNKGMKTYYKFDTLMSSESKPVSEKLMAELKMWESVKPLNKLFKPESFEEAKRIIQNQSIKIPETQDTKKKAHSKGSLAQEFRNKMQDGGIKVDPNTGNEE